MIVHARHKILLTIVLGITQMLEWASTYYLPVMIAQPMADALDMPVLLLTAIISLLSIYYFGVKNESTGKTAY